MGTPIPRRSRRLLGLICAATAIAIAACSANGANSPTNPALPRGAHRPAAPTPTPTGYYSWTFQTINNTAGGNNSRITGLNDDESPEPKLVGVNGTTHADFSSFTVPYPYNSFNTNNNYGANGTYITTVDNEAQSFEGGTEYSPPPGSPLACTTCGVVWNSYGTGTGYGASGGCGGSTNAPVACEWTFLKDPGEGTQSCSVTQGESIGDPHILVGYYETGSSACGTQAFEAYYFYATGETFVDFNVPGAVSNSTEALGTNNEGDVVGIGSFNGAVQGWFYQDGLYCTGLAFPKTLDNRALNTYPLAVNWQGEVVGYYTGSDNVPHGFYLVDPRVSQASQKWEAVIDNDQSVSNDYTTLTGVNNHHQITGYFKNSSGHLEGFIGFCTGGSQGCSSGSGPPSDGQRRAAKARAIRDLVERRPEAGTSGCSLGSAQRRRGA